MMILIVSLMVSCKTTTKRTIFNPDAMYIIGDAKGEVLLYSKDPGKNAFTLYGWMDLKYLEGYSIRKIDWSRNE